MEWCASDRHGPVGGAAEYASIQGSGQGFLISSRVRSGVLIMGAGGLCS